MASLSGQCQQQRVWTWSCLPFTQPAGT